LTAVGVGVYYPMSCLVAKESNPMCRTWALSLAMSGLILVSIVYGCIWYAIPDRPVAKSWALGVSVLFVPYALSSYGCLVSQSSTVRVSAILVVFAGSLLALSVISDAWPTFSGGHPPGMPGSIFVIGFLAMPQYFCGLLAALVGITNKNKSST
jgi:hypothetical protein